MLSTVEKTRDKTIDVLKGIGILFMVLGHVYLTDEFDKYIHSFHMPLFFIVSGYLFTSFQEKIAQNYFKHPEHTKRHYLLYTILHKAKSLLIPYVIYAIINYAFWLKFENYPDRDILSPIISLLTYNQINLPISGALWFLTALFFSNVIFTVFDFFIHNRVYFAITLLCIGFLMSYISNYYNFRLPLSIDISIVAVGFMMIGYLFNLLRSKCYTFLKRCKFNNALIICLTCTLLLLNFFLSHLNGYVNMRSCMYAIIPLTWINSVLGALAYYGVSVILYNYMSNSFIVKISVLYWEEFNCILMLKSTCHLSNRYWDIHVNS